MTQLLKYVCSPVFFYSVLRVSTPIIFASLAAVMANTAGIPNIALEGMMLISAFSAMMVSSLSANPYLGLLAAAITGMLCGTVLAFCTLHYKTNVILGGIAINTFASGGTVFFLYLFTGDKGASSSVKNYALANWDIPILKNIPILGQILSGHSILTYAALAFVAIIYLFLKRTALGYHMRAVGENEKAANSLGISVSKIKSLALIISGLLSGLGGAFMTLSYLSIFTRDMVAGRGWIGIAADAMGRSHVIGTFFVSLLFGFSDAFSNAMGMMGLPSDLVRIIPYCLTLLGLIIFSIRQYIIIERHKESFQ